MQEQTLSKDTGYRVEGFSGLCLVWESGDDIVKLYNMPK